METCSTRANVQDQGMESWSRTLDLDAFAEKHGTPLYITHLGQMRSNLAAFRDLVGENGNVAYPVKANPSMAVLRALAAWGCSADCATVHEMDLALAAGFPIWKLVYNSPAPDRERMAQLLSAGATVVADSEEVLDDLADSLSPQDCKGRLLVRINPEMPVEYLHRTDWEEMVAHASSSGKFGIPSEELVRVLLECPLPVRGLHLHVGTQMDNTATFVNALGLLHRLADMVAMTTPHRIDTLDLGGGLGIGFLEGQRFPTIPEYADSLRGLLRPGCRYLVEPGHALVGNATALLASVREMKSLRGRRWAILDAGSDQLIKVTLLSWQHRILDRHHRALPTSGPDAVGGPLCFAGDVLLPSTDLAGVARGDPLLIQHAGAYCFAVANHFNGLSGPAHVMLDDDGADAVGVYREEDPFCNQSIVGFDWLAPPAPGSIDVPPAPLPLEHIRSLSSTYLHQDAAADSYEYLETRLEGPRTLAFRVDARSPLNAVSMPFAVRMAADATIVATLYLLGKQSKDVSVWGTRLYMTSDTLVRLRGPIELRVHVTPSLEPGDGRRATHLAHWEIEGGKFRGSFRLTL